MDFDVKFSYTYFVCSRIFLCKIQCTEENKHTDGIVVRRGDAETLVLQ